MKRILLLICISFGSLVLAQSQGDLLIKIGNLRAAEGHLRLALFDSPEDFPKEGNELKLYIIPVHSLSIEFKIVGVALNDYAIAVFHDQNNDGICNKNMLGIPIEAYGFSNNIFHRFRAPSFEEAKINSLTLDTVHISMKH